MYTKNNSKFFITFGPLQHLDNKNVVFGEVIDGFSIIENLKSLAGNGGTPLKTALITKSGEIEMLNRN
mgnify:CR=1 FL=1